MDFPVMILSIKAESKSNTVAKKANAVYRRFIFEALRKLNQDGSYKFCIPTISQWFGGWIMCI